MKKSYKLSLAAIAASVLLVGCGSAEEIFGDDDDNSPNIPFTGQFVDTYVKGLNYKCIGFIDGVPDQITASGITNEKGEFTCSNRGELVEFSVGNYVIGSYRNSGFDKDAAPIVTPYDLYSRSFEAAINLAQLLQTLDDGTTEGALTIPANFTALDNVDTKPDNADFDALMADALPNVTALVSEEVAEAHLDETLVSLGIRDAPAPAPAPVPSDDTAALESFVSGKLISVEGELEATFASDGSYSEVYQDEGSTGTCSGTWKVLGTTTLETICTKDGEAISEYDTSTWEFIGVLENGMTVDIDTVYVDIDGPAYETFKVTITVSDI